MISVPLFIVLVHIIDTGTAMETTLKLLFTNGFNVIRCSKGEVQVYSAYRNNDQTVQFTCKNTDKIIDDQYIGFDWKDYKLRCAGDGTTVFEQQYVQMITGVDPNNFPVDGQVGELKESYMLENDPMGNEKRKIIEMPGQPAMNMYTDPNADPDSLKLIYMWFKNHPIICRLNLTDSTKSSPCAALFHTSKEVAVEHSCYYTPGAQTAPTEKEMEDEFKQVQAAGVPNGVNKDVYVLAIPKPNSIPDDDTDENDSNADASKKPSGKTSEKLKKSKLPVLIGLLVGFIVLALVGAVCYYIFQRHHRRLADSSSDTTIENGNFDKDLSALAANGSNQSLSVASLNGTEITSKPANEEAPIVKSTVPNKKERHRTAANMIFNEEL